MQYECNMMLKFQRGGGGLPYRKDSPGCLSYLLAFKIEILVSLGEFSLTRFIAGDLMAPFRVVELIKHNRTNIMHCFRIGKNSRHTHKDLGIS